MSEDTATSPEVASSIFQSALPLEIKLERARTELLDLSARNRLLNIPRSGKSLRTIDVVDEISAEVFRLLVRENRTFTFLPGRASKTQTSEQTAEETEEILELAQPDDESLNERGVFNRHADTKLQTRLTSVGLQKRLLDLHADARTLEEEQGVNVLYLALGTLKWIDPLNATNVRYAPLILVPVSLERSSAAERFKLKWRQEDPAANLSLEAFLDRVHSLKLPSFDNGDDFDPGAYFTSVAKAITLKENWVVNPDDIVLGFFSFAKFLMYRDLDPAVWPADGKITELPLIKSLLDEGFPQRETMISDDAHIDPLIPPAEMRHIVDSDSSQTLAIHDVRSGHDLVIQGPPGTGKSQTIANVIAAAVADGKTVLFVAEKMAALEVVKRRLDQSGAGDACLELHSNKANNRLLLDELRRTWELGSPRGDFPNLLNTRLEQARDVLNGHVERMHRAHNPSGLSPYQVIGELVRLRDQGCLPSELRLELEPEHWSTQERSERESLLEELVQRVGDIGRPIDHAWWGIGVEVLLPMQVERLIQRVGDLDVRLHQLGNEEASLLQVLEMVPQESFRTFGGVINLARRIATAPQLIGDGLSAEEWGSRREDLGRLIQNGFEYQRLTQYLATKVRPSGWPADIRGIRENLTALPSTFAPEAFARVQRLRILLPQLTTASTQLRDLLQIAGESETIASIRRTLEIGRSVAAAPTASPETYTAGVWDHGLEQVGDLVDAVAALQDARLRVGKRLSDAAWSADCKTARQCLASKGTSFFRFLSSDWRSANRLVKSFLHPADLPLAEVIPLLDILLSGQRAMLTVRDGDALGQSAFGPRWRGEKSDVGELRNLLGWMRGLGLWAKEIRVIAGRMHNQSEIGVSATCLQAIGEECFPLLDAVQQDFGKVDPDPISLTLERCVETSQADQGYAAVFEETPNELTERLSLLDLLSRWQAAGQIISEGSEVGKSCFGGLWQGAKSSWDVLNLASQWVNANADIRHLTARIGDPSTMCAHADSAESMTKTIVQDTETLFRDLRVDTGKLFGVTDVSDMSVERLLPRFESWLKNPEQLSKWVAYRERADRARSLGLGQLVDKLDNGQLQSGHAIGVFHQAYYESLLADQVREEPAIARFDGHVHARLTRQFAEMDLQRIEAAKLEVVRAHHRRIPQSGGGIGPLGVLRAEIAKRRGHIPIRQLMLKAAPAVQALKPVWMMSPLSVAQFLPPGQLTFDLLVMDEASQIQPVDALGAIARCRQVVVVGDERQLPPTKFFSKMTGQLDEDDGENSQVADIESILGLFIARGLPQRMLRWHYRSRHQSLIAVSNAQFYENKLFIVPSPYTSEAGMGLRFHYVPDGRFDSGNTRVNAVEAKMVAEAVIRHALEHANLSLGVATFSANQRSAIRDQIELLRRANPAAESFFHSHSAEPFFVKNLENVQGDERDVIFISVGYGKNSQGSMTMAFGPLSSEGGERRLNVLISRAKKRCDVFSSITDEDIDTERGKGKGVFAFKLFLHFARTGRLTFGQVSGRKHDSTLEIQVADAIQGRGYQVHPRVGIAGIFIDLAIADPDRPGRYLLGIECDGASYQSARSTRDRDRLRKSVLEDHGWIIHRIWSNDWFQRPKEQLELVVAAIESAKAELDALGHHQSTPGKAVRVEIVTVEREETVEIGLKEVSNSSTDTAYLEATPSKPLGWPELHETPAPLLSQMIDEIVTIEGPVHVDEVTARIRGAWNLQRSGVRIQACVERAVAHSAAAGRVEVEGEFLAVPGKPIKIRDRAGVSSLNLRKPEMLPPAELREAVITIVRRNLGGKEDEVIHAVSRSLGFRSTSLQLRENIDSAITTLVAGGSLLRQGDLLAVPHADGHHE